MSRELDATDIFGGENVRLVEFTTLGHVLRGAAGLTG
jgi:hypothetical protein